MYIVSEICGGLGNAMFMWLIGKSTAEKYGLEFRWVRTEPVWSQRNDDYNLFYFLDEKEKLFFPIEDFKIITENDTVNIYTDFNKLNISNANILLRGYWQDVKYFDEELCKKTFMCPKEIKDKLLLKYGDFTNRVHVCVRRGDYVGFWCALSFEWYDKMLQTFFKNEKIVVNCDDIDWCKEHFSKYDAIYLDNENILETMWAGSLCKKHVIANTTYGFWQAYLSEHNDITICPKEWNKGVSCWLTTEPIF